MKYLFKKILSVLMLAVLAITMFSCNSEREITYEIHTDLQKTYLAGDYKLIGTYVKGNEELSKPKPIVITWNASEEITNFDFYLSETNPIYTQNVFIGKECLQKATRNFI